MIYHVLYKEIQDENQYWRKLKGVFTDFQAAQGEAVTFQDGRGVVDCFIPDDDEDLDTATGMPIWVLVMYESDHDKVRECVVGVYVMENEAVRGWEKYIVAMREHGYNIELRILEFKINVQGP